MRAAAATRDYYRSESGTRPAWSERHTGACGGTHAGPTEKMVKVRLTANPRSVLPQPSASNTPAAPIPVPTHMVTMPYFCLRRRSPCTSVAVRTAPVAPSG